MREDVTPKFTRDSRVNTVVRLSEIELLVVVICEVCWIIVLGFVTEASFCFSPRAPDFKGDF